MAAPGPWGREGRQRRRAQAAGPGRPWRPGALSGQRRPLPAGRARAAAAPGNPASLLV